ncbi:MAG: hypothetical protein EHM61_04010 [Acidobacteria bacterium]|nr:MAG: hypothetical protein EHM61_04010 [Acidobacteriota bacterium]
MRFAQNGRTEPRFGFQAEEVTVKDSNGSVLFEGRDVVMNVSQRGVAVLVGAAPGFIPVPGSVQNLKVEFKTKGNSIPVIPISLSASVQHTAKGWIGMHIEAMDKNNRKALDDLLGHLACERAIPNPHWKEVYESVGVAINTIGVGFGIWALVFAHSQTVRFWCMRIMVASVFVYVLLRLLRARIEWREASDWP